MQQNKDNSKISVLQEVASTPAQIVDSLTLVFSRFRMRTHFEPFNALKFKGTVLAVLFQNMLIMPFIGFANVYSMMSFGLLPKDVNAKKMRIIIYSIMKISIGVCFYTALQNSLKAWLVMI